MLSIPIFFPLVTFKIQETLLDKDKTTLKILVKRNMENLFSNVQQNICDVTVAILVCAQKKVIHD